MGTEITLKLWHSEAHGEKARAPLGDIGALKQIWHASQEFEGARTNETKEHHEPPKKAKFYGGFPVSSTDINWFITFVAGGTALQFLMQIKPLIERWLNNQGSSSITIKAKGLEINVRGTADVDKAIDAFQKLEKAVKKKPTETAQKRAAKSGS